MKPIMQLKGAETFKYRYRRVMYAVGVPIEVYTDLSKKQFGRYLDGKYTMDQIKKFECEGKF